MAAMSTLRSLCMVRVLQLNFPASLLSVTDLPAALARDVAKARLFQGNFIIKGGDPDNIEDPRRIVEVALTITYDGANWTFSHRSQDVVYPYFCHECWTNQGVVRPGLVTVIMQEGVAHPTFLSEDLFNFSLEWLGHQGLGPDMKLYVEMNKEGSHGKLIFKKCSITSGGTFTRCFEVSCHKQGRNLDNYYYVDSSSNTFPPPGHPLRSLASVDVTAEMAFPHPQNCICSDDENDWHYYFNDESFDYSSDSDLGVYGQEDEDSDSEEPDNEDGDSKMPDNEDGDSEKLGNEDGHSEKLSNEDGDSEKPDNEDGDSVRPDNEDTDFKKPDDNSFAWFLLNNKDADLKKPDNQDSVSKKLEDGGSDCKKLDDEDSDTEKLRHGDSDSKKMDDEDGHSEKPGTEDH